MSQTICCAKPPSRLGSSAAAREVILQVAFRRSASDGGRVDNSLCAVKPAASKPTIRYYQVGERIDFRRWKGSIMWVRQPVLILTISVAVLGLLFAIRRILAEGPVVTSSGGAASDKGASRGTAGVIARPPVIFMGFLALAAVLEALVPSLTTTLVPHARYSSE